MQKNKLFRATQLNQYSSGGIMKVIVAMVIAVAFALAGVSENASAQSAQELKGGWNDGSYSGSLQILFHDGWKTGFFKLWCSRGATYVNFVLKSQSGAERRYEVIDDSNPNNCGVSSFTIRPDAAEWRGDVMATYSGTTFSVK